MRRAIIRYKGQDAAILSQDDAGRFHFRYTDAWYTAAHSPAISLTLPMSQQEYHSNYLFPCFYNMLAEGSNKELVCFEMRIDPEDHFSLLMHTARHDSIGAITVQPMDVDA
ncbi:MAG: phosphatidylinositol kinase [Bacteroidetes bacterium]|nr:phosphatidylinositol kinase [Bacteroidota bacterium]